MRYLEIYLQVATHKNDTIILSTHFVQPAAAWDVKVQNEVKTMEAIIILNK